MTKSASTVILPPFDPPPRTFSALVAAVERRVAMARALDPLWGGLPKPLLDTVTPLDAIVVIAAFVLAPIGLGALAFSRGPVSVTLALAAAVATLFAWRACRRGAAFAREWRARGVALPASVVVAHEDLLDEKKTNDANGMVVVGFGPDTARSVQRLVRVSKAVARLAEEPRRSLPEHWLPIHDFVNARLARGEWHVVPVEIAGVENVHVTRLFIHRDRLPRAKLDRRTFFCLVDAERSPEGIAVLPADFWWTPETDALTRVDPTDDRGGGPPEDGDLAIAEPDDFADEDAPQRAAAPGVPLRAEEPVVFLPLVGRTGYAVRVAIAGALALGTIVPLLARPASARSPFLLGAAIGAAIALAFAIRSRRSRYLADGAGLERRTAFGESRLAWDEIESLRMGAFTNRVTGRSRRKGGRRVVLPIDADNLALRHVVDAILERAPALAPIGWAAGLEKPAAPPDEDAPRPRSARRVDGDLVIEGPGESRVVFDSKHPDLDAIERAVSARLAPLLLRDAARGAPAARRAR